MYGSVTPQCSRFLGGNRLGTRVFEYWIYTSDKYKGGRLEGGKFKLDWQASNWGGAGWNQQKLGCISIMKRANFGDGSLGRAKGDVIRII